MKTIKKRRGKGMLCLGIMFVIIGGIIIYWNISYSPFKTAFTKEMEERVSKFTPSEEKCTGEEIAKLPEPLRRYCDYIGLENYPKYQATRTNFYHTDFVFDASTGKTLDMDYDLWLFYDKPYRSAYCKSSMYGIPFDGIDYCTDDLQGGMKGILGKAIQIFDERTDQGYQAEMISWFAESLTINPSVVLSPYVEYETIDDTHVQVTVNSNGVTGTGMITFDEQGAITEFYSDERQVEKIEGVDTRVGWRCENFDYKEDNGIKRAHTVRSIKVFPDREVTYFASDNYSIDYFN